MASVIQCRISSTFSTIKYAEAVVANFEGLLRNLLGGSEKNHVTLVQCSRPPYEDLNPGQESEILNTRLRCSFLSNSLLNCSSHVSVDKFTTGCTIRGSSPGRGWEFFSPPPRPDRFWGQRVRGALYLGVKRSGHETDHSPHLVPWSRIRRAIPPLPNMLLWRGAQTERLYLLHSAGHSTRHRGKIELGNPTTNNTVTVTLFGDVSVPCDILFFRLCNDYTSTAQSA
jgi:hypothetical protein